VSVPLRLPGGTAGHPPCGDQAGLAGGCRQGSRQPRGVAAAAAPTGRRLRSGRLGRSSLLAVVQVPEGRRLGWGQLRRGNVWHRTTGRWRFGSPLLWGRSNATRDCRCGSSTAR